MSKLTDVPKRILIGRALRSDKLGETLLPKRIALPVFASDALSSVAYAPEEILLTLSVAGVSAIHFSWQIGVVVAIVMLAVVASYRQNVHAYPSGGGDYEVATVNHGPNSGLIVASALMVDYVLTVAVSTTSGVANVVSAVPALRGHEVGLSILVVLILMSMNLRGVRESGTAFAIPTYAFMAGVFSMTLWGLFRHLALGADIHAESAAYHLQAEPGETGLAGFALIFLLLRAFSSGCAALTGVEAISNGVPAFRKPKSRNAANTLLLMGTIAVTMFMGIIYLASLTGVRMADDPATQLIGAPENYHQKTALAQISEAVFSDFKPGFFFVAAVTGLILVLAANTAFNGFPVLGSILAQDRYLPRQLHTRGDRLAFSNGIIVLAGIAMVFIVAYGADPTRLIQLYIVGVFVSFNMSQSGMIRHWTRLLRTETDPKKRSHMIRSRAINTFGLVMTALVLIVVLVTKFTHAWVAIMLMVVLFVMMKAIRRHYDGVAEELVSAEEPGEDAVLPSRVHSIVLVSKLHKPTLRALAYARLARSSVLEAVTVNVDPPDTKALQAEWHERGIEVPLKVLDSPYREITRPILEYVKNLRRSSPRDVVTVYIPEYVVGHWYEQLLHNQSALRLKGRLLFTPGVMVVSVPWQLESSERRKQQREWSAPGSVRRGEPRRQRKPEATVTGPDKGAGTNDAKDSSS
ncbi:APC family permease [Peterkaempfera bronchialis]|uniref:APC family permease n=1 Tax=Peterkaempfera bronchialis TaxID=2126346 RepID=A0A345T6J9_9ACTN|nr:APC family permease [Peterkaempfera bronchialis]AXI81604.1 APC family permease [Peterkaempfera bronchialis]